MIEEAYVSFEVAKLLKEKGFKEECSYRYVEEPDYKTPKFVCSPIGNGSKYLYNAPTHQMAMRWLREVHDIKIMIRPYIDGTYSYEILNGFWYVNFDSYEDATEEAIKYCLEYLI